MTVTDDDVRKVSKQERDERILQLRASGATLESIAAEFGLTRERVRQIVSRDGGVPAAQVRLVRRQEAAARVREYVSGHPGVSLGEVASALGWSAPRVAGLLDVSERRLLASKRRYMSPVYSDGQVLAAIRAAALMHGGRLSTKAYDDLVHGKTVVGPTSARVVQRFGSWSRACSLAGVECGRRTRRVYGRYWNRDTVIAAVRDYLMDPESAGTFAGWDQWRQGRPETLPCAVTLRSAFGSWTELRALALAPARAA